MTEKDAAMIVPGTKAALEYAEQVLERTLSLAQSQLDVAAKVGTTAGERYRNLLSKSAGPSASLPAWPAMMESTFRSSTESAAALMKNAMAFQTEMIKIMQTTMVKANRQFGARMTDIGSKGTAVDIPIAGAPRHIKGHGLHGVQKRKAA